jgi:OOP family OmpA-OmpF porin
VGCPRHDSITLKGVGFEYDSATLTAESRPVLDEVAADLKKYPRLKVELQGHTDSRGSDQYNLKLSQRRAEAVREYLIRQGVSPDQLTARGYGETQPKASNDTDEGRAENRRVDMKVLENPGDLDVKTEDATPVQ